MSKLGHRWGPSHSTLGRGEFLCQAPGELWPWHFHSWISLEQISKQAEEQVHFPKGNIKKHFVSRKCPRQMKKSSTPRAREEVGDEWRYCHMGTSNTCLSKNFSYLYNFQKSHFQLLTFHQLPVSQILSFCVLLLKGLKASGSGGGVQERFFDALGPAGKLIRPALLRTRADPVCLSKGLKVYQTCSPLQIFW